MISYEKDGVKFNFRVAAIIFNKDKSKILVLHTPGASFCVLPGGRVEEMESSEDAIIRELKEEMDINSTVKLSKMIENFFYLNGKTYHEISCYFLVTSADESIYEKAEFAGQEAKDWFKWISLDELPIIDFKPEILKKYIIERDFKLEHIVLNEIL